MTSATGKPSLLRSPSPSQPRWLRSRPRWSRSSRNSSSQRGRSSKFWTRSVGVSPQRTASKLLFDRVTNIFIQMQDWFQVCNLRTTLLHMQYLYCSLKQQTEAQAQNVQRAHRDRVIQYSRLSEQLNQLRQSNFKKLLILKLEAGIDAYGSDERVWESLDDFEAYSRVVEQDMAENIGKVYLGKGVFFDKEGVEEALRGVEKRIEGFMDKQEGDIGKFEARVKELKETRRDFEEYLTRVDEVRKQVAVGYGDYLRRKLQKRSKQIDKSISKYRSAILGI